MLQCMLITVIIMYRTADNDSAFFQAQLAFIALLYTLKRCIKLALNKRCKM